MDYFLPLFFRLLNRSTGGSLPFFHDLIFGIAYGISLSLTCVCSALSLVRI